MYQLMRKATALILGLCILVGGFLLLSFGVVFVLLMLLLAAVMTFLGLRRPGSVVIFQTRRRPTPDEESHRQPDTASETCIDLDPETYSSHARAEDNAPRRTLPEADKPGS